MSRIGVLALQGGFLAHANAIRKLGHEPVLVRSPSILDGSEGLVLPGGESSSQLSLIDRFGLEEPLRAWFSGGKPVLATCAGLILAARGVASPVQRSLGMLDVDVVRNAYGRQLQSFEAIADDGRLPLVFIRAPRITRVGPSVEVLATLRGEPILVRQGNIVGATFHPELTSDSFVHQLAFGSEPALSMPVQACG
jgi:5'-phosphate synthase pdxT subunit